MLLNSQPEISKQDHDLDEPVPNLPTRHRNHSLPQCKHLRRTVAAVSLEVASKLLANSTSLLLRRVSIFLHFPSVLEQTP